jgi:dolichyl-phosphate beta-glucosyltransferase
VLRELLGRTYNSVVRALLTPGISDTQCGAKAAPASVWSEILGHCREDGFAGDVEMIATALALDLPVQEMGVTWAHDNRTRVHVLRDGMAMVAAVMRIWRRLNLAEAKSLQLVLNR